MNILEAILGFWKNMISIRQFYIINILLISSISNASNIYLQIEGLPKILEKNIIKQLSISKNNKVASDQQYIMHVNDIIRNRLKALGYYEPKISFNLHKSFKTQRQQCQTFVIHILLGRPILIGGINIILHGEAQSDEDYLNLLNNCPKIGTILNHRDFDNFKKMLTNIALNKGYFRSHFNKSQLGISLRDHQAFWDIDYDSGKRYQFGTVTFEGSQINEKYLQNLIPFKTGDYYQSNDLAELNRRFSATGWFNSVIIAPNFDKALKTKILPIHGIVTPRAKNSIETGIGYSTDIGPHMKIVWKKPWISSYGHSLAASFSTSILEKQFNLIYKIPLLQNPLERFYLLQSGFKRTNLNNTKSDSSTLIISRYWNIFKNWQQAINLRWSIDHFAQANIVNTTKLVYPGININCTKSYGGLMPTYGDFKNYSISYSNTIWGSDVNFLVIQAQNIWIRTFHNYHRFITRSNIGWIKSNNFDRVPPDLRFFARGDRSIRGFKYKTIRPKNDNSKLVGASKLIIGSFEYQYNLSSKWWGAVFSDFGKIENDTFWKNLKIGSGIGIRWQSPIGPIKFDFAIPVNDREKYLQFYIGIGPEL